MGQDNPNGFKGILLWEKSETAEKVVVQPKKHGL
jgi:hypothetical protein